MKDPEKWKLIINKRTDQNGDSYDPSMDLGRVDMKMKPPVAIEKLKYTITTSSCRLRFRSLSLSLTGLRSSHGSLPVRRNINSNLRAN